MRRKNALPELLSPAGSLDALVAAVNAGADAVYVGASAFNARAFAKNFTEEELVHGIEYAHLSGVRVYVTLNTQIVDREYEEFLRTAEKVVNAGADAVIVADFGAAKLLHECFPTLELHASTQMSLHSTDGADALLPYGITRVVPARELSLADIRSLIDTCRAEVEVFLHGALCVSHSGQCLMSAMIGGRSGNRGECAQPCRLPYNGGYPLSLRDLSLASHIPELIGSGVSSLKIEGRMKSPAYVGGVTRIYRRLLDERRAATPEESAALARLFSRSGFTDGYFTGKYEKMTGIRREGDITDSRDAAPADTEMRRFPLRAEIVIERNKNAILTLHFNDKSVTAIGNIPEEAATRPLTASDVATRIAKMGGTPFSLTESDIRVTLEEGLNLSPASLNRLRRDACALLTPPREAIAAVLPPMPKRAETEEIPTALCYNAAQLAACDKGYFRERYLLLSALPEVKNDLPDGVILPPVIFDSERDSVLADLKTAAKRGVRLALCGNAGHFRLAAEAGLSPVGGHRLNIRSRMAFSAARELFGIKDTILSPELTLPQCRDIGGRAIVYGRIPLMLLERCFVKENFGCDACRHAAFTDRTGAAFPILRLLPHRNLLLNSVVTYMGDRASDVKNAGVSPVFLFTTEKESEVKRMVSAYRNREKLPFPVRRMGISEPKPAETDKQPIKKKRSDLKKFTEKRKIKP